MNVTELEQCIELYGKDLYAFCLQITNNRQEADELYQDTFLKAVERLTTIDVEKNSKSYLLSISIRLWKNRKRKYAWRQRIAGMQSFEEVQNSKQALEQNKESSPEDRYLFQEQAEFVRKKIAELEDKYRIPIYLYYMEELSIQEVSVILKLPKGTVKSRLFKGRELLKKKLEVAFYEG